MSPMSRSPRPTCRPGPEGTASLRTRQLAGAVVSKAPPWVLALVVAGSLALTACSEPAQPDASRWEVDPPASYQVFWSDTERCSGLDGDFGRVTWFWAQSIGDNGSILGQWNSRREITILWTSRFDAGVVKHEILHDLLRGDPDHQDLAWIKCGLPLGVG